jgi:hypothetical protein
VIWDFYKRGCFLPILQTLPSSQTPHRHPSSALFGRNTTTCPLALHLASSILSYPALVLIAAQVASPHSSIPWLLDLLCHRIGSPNANSFARASSPSIIVSPPSTHPSLLHSSKTLRQGLHVFERVSISPSSQLPASIFFFALPIFPPIVERSSLSSESTSQIHPTATSIQTSSSFSRAFLPRIQQSREYLPSHSSFPSLIIQMIIQISTRRPPLNVNATSPSPIRPGTPPEESSSQSHQPKRKCLDLHSSHCNSDAFQEKRKSIKE